MKTLEQWENSGLDLVEFLGDPCEIGMCIVDYLRDCTVPAYCSDLIIQGGDPIRTEGDVSFYQTILKVDRKDWYIGILPEFKPITF